MSATRGLVLYCDGGANPNPNGPSGSGVHGYIYGIPEEKGKPTRIDSWIATDEGYVLKKDFDTGMKQGVVVEQIVEIVDAIGLGTNNIAEMNAVIAGFEFANTISGIARVHIICDSEYTLKGMNEWIPGWKNRRWTLSDGSPVKNQTFWKKLDDLMVISGSKFELTSSWIKGHNDDFGNSKADCLATMAVTRSYLGDLGRTVVTWPASEYFAKLDGVHPFISLKRVYFNTNEDFHQPGMYYQSDGSGKEFITGKRSSEATFSVVCLNEPDVVMEAAIQATIARKSDYNRIVYGKVDMIRNQEVLQQVNHWGALAFVPDRRNLNMNTLDKKPIVVEVRADELPLRAFEAMTHLESLLIEFQNNYLTFSKFFEGDGRGFQLCDVTDHFYTTRLKKSGKDEIEIHELKKDFGVGIQNTRLTIPFKDKNVTELDVILSFSEDVPPRNSFKHFELINPLVYIVAWKDGDYLVRYATIVKTDDAVGIWSNYFANNILLKK